MNTDLTLAIRGMLRVKWSAFKAKIEIEGIVLLSRQMWASKTWNYELNLRASCMTMPYIEVG